MKLLICDTKKMYTFKLPDNPEDYFIINFRFHSEKMNFNETLTLKYTKDNWMISADDKLSIKSNESILKSIILKEREHFKLKFADMSDFFDVFVVPNTLDFISYNIENKEIITIGSDSNSNIIDNSLLNTCVKMLRDGYDFFVERIDNNICSAYVNGYTFTQKKIYAGDILFINGIDIIYMKDRLLINLPPTKNITINDLPLANEIVNYIDSPITPVNDIEKNVKLYDDEQIYTHSPRLISFLEEESLEIEPPPQKEIEQKTPAIFTLGASFLMTLASASSLLQSINEFYKQEEKDYFELIVQLITFGILICTSLLLPMLNQKWDKHVSKKKEKKRVKLYNKYIEEKKVEIESIVEKQKNILNSNNLTLDQIIQRIKNEPKNIWDREITDKDFLTIVLGRGDILAPIQITGPKKKFELEKDALLEKAIDLANEKPVLNNVPVTYSLLENIIAPFVISSNFKDDYIKSILLQILYHHCGRDLKILIITDEYNDEKWEFLKNISYNWDRNYQNRFFASKEEDLYQLNSIIEQVLEKRLESKEEKKSFDHPYKEFDEYYLIITDNYSKIRDLSIIDKIFNLDENYGFSVLIFENSMKKLPTKFKSFINITNDNAMLIIRDDYHNKQISFKPEYMSNLAIEKFTFPIANIPVTIKSEISSVPETLNFLEMFHAGRVEQLNVLARWQKNVPILSLKTIIGVKGDNKSIELDLHEKFHGPHGLIAGTTGSGKSEFIITYILSMAVNYHPYEVQFILIDYKGGGLAGAFENRETGLKLPHLVGTITNLDKSEMNRTLVSIKSELQRRQRVFNETREKLDEGTIDIYKYQRLYRERKVSNPMSHLFIIADEFAELKAQQPEFMNELVSAARIGRSLGIHLILATQKPSGVVDDQITSNTRFRVCLKVQTVSDSTEMLKTPDAAYIKQAGRFYLQVGNDEIYELGQSGWAGAKYVPSDNVKIKINDDIEFLNNNGEVIKTINEEIKKDDTKDYGEQLVNIVKYLFQLAKKEDIVTSNLWLENIPDVIYYDNIIRKYNVKSSPFIINSVIGEYDDPSNQTQGLVTLPIQKTGNVFVVGISGSGKTTLLQEFIYSNIINHTSDEINLYLLDFGAEKLKKFSKAPQVGEVLTINDGEKIKHLFYMLKEEMNDRLRFYSDHGGSFDIELKSGKCSFPNIVIIINDIEVFRDNFEEIYDGDFISFARNCTKVGMYIIVTSASYGSLSYALENSFPKKIILNLSDSNEYAGIFEDSPVPKKNPGRGIIELDKAYEFQIPLIFNEEEFDKKLTIVLNQLDKFIKKRAKKVPVIPEEIRIEYLLTKLSNIENVPLGINLKTALIETKSFDNLLNVMSSSNNAPIKKFLPFLVNVISYIHNTKVMIINSMAGLKFDLPENENIKYYDSNFDKLLNIINTNIEKYKESLIDDNFIIILLGYGKLQKELEKKKNEDSDILTIEDVIYNAHEINNFKFIIYDSERALSLLGDGKIDSYFKRTKGIWLGKDFDSQSLFEVKNQYTDMVITNSNIVKIENGEAEYVKFM